MEEEIKCLLGGIVVGVLLMFAISLSVISVVDVEIFCDKTMVVTEHKHQNEEHHIYKVNRIGENKDFVIFSQTKIWIVGDTIVFQKEGN